MTIASLRSEFLRVRADYVLGGCLAVALVLAGALALNLPRTAAAVRAALPDYLAASVVQTAVVATFCGVLRYCLDHRTGVVARSILVGHRAPTLAAKAVMTALGGALIGVVGGLGSLAALLVAVPGVHLTAPAVATVLGGVAVSAVAAVWGLCFGVVVRNYFLAPLIALGAFLGSGLVMDSWPAVGKSLPMGTIMSIVYPSRLELLPAPLAVVTLLTWILVLGAVASGAMALRDSI